MNTLDTSGRRFRPLALIFVGLALGIASGLAAGLYYAWILNPVVYVGDSSARAPEVQSSAVALFTPPPQPAATPPIDPEQAPPLFAADIAAASPTAGSLRPTPTPAATLTATPVTIPTDVAPRFQLLNREQLCPPENEGGRIEVLVVDANGTPQPGTAITVSWPTGSDRFVTGFKEGGYGDFVMQPDTVYRITLPDGRTGEENLSLTSCSDGQPTTWRLTFLKDEG